MRKIVLSIILTGISIGLNAQWSKNGTNLTTSDNIGIGNTIPEAKLDIYGDNKPVSLKIIGGSDNSNSATINLGVVNGRDWELVAQEYVSSKGYALSFNQKTNDYQGPVTFSWMNNEKVRIEPNGNMGIGLSKPLAKFHIFKGLSNGIKDEHATSIIEGKDARLQLLSSNEGGHGSSISLTNETSSWSLTQKTSNIGNRFDIGYRVSDNIEDIVASQKIYFSILNNGNVGIGTLKTGNHKLAVNGSIGAREIKVEVNEWPDFVFYKDYELPTLKEVENHVIEKGHLKGVPSAKEIEKNGVFLGEINAKLLQKIEELTLYTIQQDKDIKELKQEKVKNEKQQEEIEKLKALVYRLLKDKQ